MKTTIKVTNKEVFNMTNLRYNELITLIKNAKTHYELDEIERAYIVETQDKKHDKSLLNWYIKQRREQIK